MSDNSSDFRNDSVPADAAAAARHNFPALIFGILLIVVIAAGNVLVCLSVYLEKALKTTTNYFIVSLAFADLLLAVLVLPLFVYAEVRIEPRFGPEAGGYVAAAWQTDPLHSAAVPNSDPRTAAWF